MTEAPKKIYMMEQGSDDYGLMPMARTTKDHPRAIPYHHDSVVAEKDAEIERLREVGSQAVSVIEAVQLYEQPYDPDEENMLTMCEHEVFDFDVEASRAALNKEADLHEARAALEGDQ